MAEPLSEGAGGQFLGAHRFLSMREQAEAVETFIAKTPALTEGEKDIARASWLAAIAFDHVAQFDGFDEALATLAGDREEVPATT